MFDLPRIDLSPFSIMSAPRKSWFWGHVKHVPLFHPVFNARFTLTNIYGNESKVTELRNQLENIFSLWRNNHCTQPLRGEYKDKVLDDCPPYVCGGDYINDYADLLLKLRKEAYPPLLALDNEIGYQCVSALLVLSEAANSRIDSAIKAHWEIERYESEHKMRFREIELMAHEITLRHIERSVLFKKGGSRRKGKIFEPKASIKRICLTIQSTKFNDVLEALRDAEKCNDWYESISAPIGVLFTGIDADAQTISFLKRGDNPDAQKQISYKRLWDILTEIKKT